MSVTNGETDKQVRRLRCLTPPLVVDENYLNDECVTKRPRIETEEILPLPQSGMNSDRNEQSLKVLHHEKKTQEVEWNFREEVITIDEKVTSIPPESSNESLDVSILTTWRKVVTKSSITGEVSEFVTKTLHEQLLKMRAVVTEWQKSLLLGARCRANPFETVRRVFFMNRAALKIANLDAIVGFELTSPKTSKGDMMVPEGELFYFADVCAGPGGFSEYVLWKKKWEAKGFGFTLKNTECDFDLGEFKAGTPESFEVHYGAKGDGNVLDRENAADFIECVLESTDGNGVHLMMADAGLEIGDKNDLEELCKSLYLAQFFVALGVVREGGSFVCKLFDTISPFSVGLIYLIYHSFEQVAIHKPNSSRPGNPERYIICRRRRGWTQTRGIYEYLQKCHEMLWNYENNKNKGVAMLDISELVPMNMLTKKDSAFFNYIKNTNDTSAICQIKALKKMEAFCEDQTLTEIRQTDCRHASLVYWGIPDVTRRELAEIPLITIDTKTFSKCDPTKLTKGMVPEVFKSPFDWRFVVLGNGPFNITRAFYHGIGGTAVHRLQSDYWKPLDLNLSLPKDTLVYAELVNEVSIDLKQIVTAFHIIDGLLLGGKDISALHYTQRHAWCVKFAKAINKPRCPKEIPVRAKRLTRMEHIGSIFESITKIEDSNVPEARRKKIVGGKLFPVEGSSTKETYFSPVGLLFLKITKEPWMMEYDQKAGRKFWLNMETKQSAFDCPADSIADFVYSMQNSTVWNWDENSQVDVLHTLISNPSEDKSDEVQAKQLVDHVNHFLAHVLPVPAAVPIFPFAESEDESHSE